MPPKKSSRASVKAKVSILSSVAVQVALVAGGAAILAAAAAFVSVKSKNSPTRYSAREATASFLKGKTPTVVSRPVPVAASGIAPGTSQPPASGTLLISTSAGTRSSDIVLGGSAAVSVSQFKFLSSADVTVRSVTLRNCVGMQVAADTTCTQTGETNGNERSTSLVKLSYKDVTGATVTRSLAPYNGTVRFDGLELNVPANAQDVVATVTVDTVSYDMLDASAQRALEGSPFQWNIVADDFQAVNRVTAENVVPTYTSGNNLTVVANPMTMRKSKPTISLASGSPSGAGIPGLAEILRFNVSSDAKGPTFLKKLTFDVSTTDGANTDWDACGRFPGTQKVRLEDAAAPSHIFAEDGVMYFYDAQGNGCGRGDTAPVRYIVFEWAASEEQGGRELEIGAGQTKTFRLIMDTMGASLPEDDSIRVGIAQDTNTAVLQPGFVWRDGQLSGDIPGQFIRNFPVTGGTIVY